MLVEFGSAVDAGSCAMSVQSKMDTTAAQKITFRAKSRHYRIVINATHFCALSMQGLKVIRVLEGAVACRGMACGLR
jgi:GTP cyclohydrolase I